VFPTAARIVGGMGAKKVEAEKLRFQGDKDAGIEPDPDCNVILCNLKAGGVGHTLTEATIVVFVEMWSVPGDMEQCEDRAHRIGLEHNVLDPIPRRGRNDGRADYPNPHRTHLDHRAGCGRHRSHHWQGNKMTPLRRKRLILLASQPKWHKRFYSGYYELMLEYPSPVAWALGTAFLTDFGWEEYRRFAS
jgi:hypothetical protein